MKTHTFRDKTFYYERRDEFWVSVKEGGWETETFDVFDKLVKEGDNFLDIGAWMGICSLYASALGAKCFAVEPDKIAYEELVENAIFNGDNVETLNVAITDRDGVAILYNEENKYGDSMSSLTKTDTKKSMHVCKSMRLETAIRAFKMDKVDFIKMDTEGAEQIIIPDCLDLLAEVKCPLYISFHPDIIGRYECDRLHYMLSQIYTVSENLIHYETLFLP